MRRTKTMLMGDLLDEFFSQVSGSRPSATRAAT